MARAPFRIESLNIRNFRGIDAVDLKFQFVDGEPGGLAVLAGDNGVGKTAILEAILLVLGRTDLLPADAAPIQEQVRFGSSNFSIEANISPLPEGQSGNLRAEMSVLLQPRTITRHSPGFSGETFSNYFWRQVSNVAPNIEYFSARREPKAFGDAPDPGASRSELEALRVAELKKRLVSAYYRGLRARQGSPNQAPAFERTQNFVRKFLGDTWTLDVIPISNNPGSGDEVVVRRGELPPDLTSLAMAREGAAAGRKEIPTILPIDRLSSGQIALFAFAGPLVFRDAPADVVVIDEPEQHMHVQWQRHFMQWLRELSPESHFIVATHSPEVLDSALSFERFILVGENDPRAQVVDEKAAE